MNVNRSPITVDSYAVAAPIVEQEPEAANPTILPERWAGPIGFENVPTGDGRIIELGALQWETPQPIRIVLEDNGSHDGAVTVGQIERISRNSHGVIHGEGTFDLGSEAGREAARLVNEGVLAGVSMDLDSVEFEVRAREPDIPDETIEAERDGAGRVKMFEHKADDEVVVTKSARIRGATIVSIPAFKDAKIAPIGDSLTASAAPVKPPADWFYLEEAGEPTPLTVLDDGQVFGHLALWETCHIAEPDGRGVCVTPPRNPSGYPYFHTGMVLTADGSTVPSGTIRLATTHADPSDNARQATAHYEDTGLVGADVRVSDGEHGIWVAGALRPRLEGADVRDLRAAPLSGDWREVNGVLELVGVLSVNLPGFPVPRPAGMVASGSLTTLVAAGTLQRSGGTENDVSGLRESVDRLRLQARVRDAVSGFTRF